MVVDMSDMKLEEPKDTSRETTINEVTVNSSVVTDMPASPRKKRWQLVVYLRLLVSAEPKLLDAGLLGLGLVAAVATGVPLPLLAVVFGQLIDDFNGASCAVESSTSVGSADDSHINGRILLVVYLAIGQFVAIYVHLLCWSFIGSRLAQRTRELYLKNLLRQEPSFFDKFNEGDISSRLNGDIQAIRNGTSEKVGICISAVACLIGAYIVAFVKYPRLAGILVCLIPAYLIMSLGGGFFIEKYSTLLSDHVAAAASIASEALSNITVVHAFGASHRLEAIFGLEMSKAKAAGLKKAIATGVQSGLLYFIAYAANGLAFWQGSKAVARSVQDNTAGTTVGSIFTVIFVVVDATVVLSQTIPLLPVFSAATAAFLKLEQDIQRRSKIDSSSLQGKRLGGIQGHLKLCNVTFSHPSRPNVRVLKNVSLEIPAGKHTAIVGPSGSGKSTIAGLLVRLYDPDTGSILLDDEQLLSLNIRDLRSRVCLAQQEGGLLDQSILENIGHGLANSPSFQNDTDCQENIANKLRVIAESLRQGQSFDSLLQNETGQVATILKLIEKAAVDADAHRFITKLRHSYGTLVGPKGHLLSGGQKQRVGLARALAKNSQIVVFDEATSALDSSTERRITSTLKTLTEGKTVVTIAHRLSTIRDADNIVVLRDGEVVEQGNHDTLMALDGFYAKLVHLQSFNASKTTTDDSGLSTTNLSDEANPAMKPSIETEIGSLEKAGMVSESVVPESKDIEKGDEQEDENAGLKVEKSIGKIWKIFGPMLRPFAWLIVPALAATTVVGAAFSIEAVIFGNTVGTLSPCNLPSTITSKGAFFGLMFFVLAIAEMIANMASWSLFGEISDGVVRTARVLSFHNLLKQDVQWHQSAHRKPAMLLNFITRDGDLLAGLSGSVLGVAFSIVVNLIVSIVLTTVIAWKIALVCLAIVPIFLGIGVMQLRVMAQFEERHEAAYTASVSIGVEAITNIKTIASFSLENDTVEAYRQSLAKPQQETSKVTFHANIWLALAYFVGNLGYALAFWWGGQQIVAGAYNQVEFLIVVFSLLVSAQLWSGMFALAPEISNARAALDRISTLLSLDSAQTGPSLIPVQSIPASQRDVEKGQIFEQITSTDQNSHRQRGLGVIMQDINFAYPSRPSIPVLKNVSLEILPGQFCAIVGSTGAGKSTVVALIERMYTPVSGSIFVGGIDVLRDSSLSFRNELAYVPQDNALFDGTVSFNIGIGARPTTEASQQEIEDACKAAHIHDTILSLPEGYQTRVGNSGGLLSGGQRQRLAIARALVRRPKVLILDEPTSALDAQTEGLLQETLDAIAKDTGMTVIVIAHRMKTIYRADIIYMFDHGQVIGRGTHEELLQTNAAYKENALHQML